MLLYLIRTRALAAFLLLCRLTLGLQALGSCPRKSIVSQRAVVDPAVMVAGGAAAIAMCSVVFAGDSIVDDKAEVEAYFNGDLGFGRWNRIYSDTDDVNSVQLDIRLGHDETIGKVLDWSGNNVEGTWCDLGCGVGSLALPVAQRGAKVYASDISAAMVAETRSRAKQAGVTLVDCDTADMETIDGTYDTVSCIDVMIHYPTDKMRGLVDKLASLSDGTIFVSFAPKTPLYQLLKKIGSLFPGPSKTTRAYLHTESDVVLALENAGFSVVKKHLTARNFYFSLLLQARRNN